MNIYKVNEVRDTGDIGGKSLSDAGSDSIAIQSNTTSFFERPIVDELETSLNEVSSASAEVNRHRMPNWLAYFSSSRSFVRVKRDKDCESSLNQEVRP